MSSRDANMASVIEIDGEIYRALVESFGEEELKERVSELLISAIEKRLEEFSREILRLERKYGVTFEEFEKMWDRDGIKNKYSHEVEGDFMDWEILEMEKKELLSLLSKLTAVQNHQKFQNPPL
jgi:hypothetical protein